MKKQILSCDWGTSSFRLRLVNVNDSAVMKEVITDKGIAAIYEEWLQAKRPEEERIGFYKTFLQSVLDKNFTHDIKDIPVIISGMASSSIGIKELDYSEIPFDLSAQKLNTITLKADKICPNDILLISGLKTKNDVMRGEETMLLGCDFTNDKDVLVIFPGTHSKHVTIKNNAATDFKTYMTGEVFNLLATKSVLSKSVNKNTGMHHESFINGVKEGVENNLLNSVFHVRTNQLFKEFTAEENYHFLSGLLIGSELKEIKTADAEIYLVCSDNLAEQYLKALQCLNKKNVIHYNADEALIKGQCTLLSRF